MIVISLSPILNEFYCQFYLVTETPTLSPSISSTDLSISSLSSSDSIVTPTPTVISSK